MKRILSYNFFVVFMILGIAIAIQIKSIQNNTKFKPSPETEANHLKAQLLAEKDAGNKIKESIKKLEREEEQNISNSENDELKKQYEFLKRLKLQAGFVGVKGPGIIIKAEDATSYDKDKGPKPFILHALDFVCISNELKKAGAQAISFNDERIITTSEQICVGPTIRVNKNKCYMPFTIKAIGDAKRLCDSMSKSYIINILLAYKINIKIDQSDKISIPGYNYDAEKVKNFFEELEEVYDYKNN